MNFKANVICFLGFIVIIHSQKAEPKFSAKSLKIVEMTTNAQSQVV